MAAPAHETGWLITGVLRSTSNGGPDKRGVKTLNPALRSDWPAPVLSVPGRTFLRQIGRVISGPTHVPERAAGFRV